MELLKTFLNDLKPEKNDLKKNGRYAYLDIIKVISAFFVVFYHYSFYSLRYGFHETEFYMPNANRIFMSFAACSVPLFFMVNGALILSKNRSVKSMYYKAVKLLVIAFIFRFLSFPAWFFVTLSGLYFLYPLFNYLWNKKRKIYYLILIAFCIFPFIFNEFTVVLKLFCDVDLKITGAKTSYSIVYFLLGNILFVKEPIKRWKSIAVAFFGILLLLFDCCVLTNFYSKIFDGVNGAFPTLGALLLSLGVFELLKSINIKFNVPDFINGGILSTYLFHMLIVNCFHSLFGWPREFLVAVIISLFIFAITVFIGFVIRKIPILCFFSKI
ncbi:MAG: acyltransferase [Clostridia bacterium]|nr:acyltransferase [Clostridia bacterium]